MITLTEKQLEAMELLGGDAEHIMLFGGSRSGKTFILVRAICIRAIKAAGSRHAILRFRFNAVKTSIGMDTFPKVMSLCFPQVKYKIDKQDWIVTIQNGSQIWFGGLDDKERTEKILGLEFATIYLNECSQIPESGRNLAVTRLAQNCLIETKEGKRKLPLRIYYDCNPPTKGHWTYKRFILKIDEETKLPLVNPVKYASMQMNPADNSANLPDGYLDTLKGLSERLQRRFLRGEYSDDNPNALFPDTVIDRWRSTRNTLPDFQRIIIGVDPSGSRDSDNAENDEIGIVVGGLGTDGNAYLIEDCTTKAGPAVWGGIVASAFDRHGADLVVAEENFGGAMVESVIQTARERTPYRKVSASRGKVVRAEPFSALYDQGKVRHAGYFRDLEDELAGMSTTGYTGRKSPNRVDAWIWVLTELFPAIVNPRKKKAIQADDEFYGWMG